VIHRLFHAVIVASALLVGAGSAWATTIQRYVLHVQPSAARRGAFDVRMELEYRSALSEDKRDGFKYIGDQAPSELRAHTRDGEPLTVRSSREGSSGQWKLEFALSRATPANDHEELRHVIVEFTQGFERRNHWTSVEGELDWSNQFRVIVEQSEYRGTGGVELRGADCRIEGEASVCRAAGAAQRLRFSLDRGFDALDALLGLLGFVGLIVGLALVLRSRRAQFVAARGVIPPAPAPAYTQPINDPQVYRAPAPLPKPEELPPPVLPASEQRWWNGYVAKVLAGSLGPAIATLVVVSAFGSALPIGVALAGAFGIGALSLVRDKSNDVADAAVLIAVAAAVAAAAMGVRGVFTASALGAVGYGVAHAIKHGGQGGSGGSSSCSSSSCGGGGGGCGGGGGGGGCGG
jgi:hypothetical protein